MYEVTWQDLATEADRIAERWRGKVSAVYGIPTGGVPLALMVAHRLDLPMVEEWHPGLRILVVDDLIDTGRTMSNYSSTEFIDAGFRKPYSPIKYAPHARTIDEWLWFPWEHDQGDPQDAVVRILQFIKEDPTREGLIETPRRVVKAYKEMTVGYEADISALLGVTFDVDCDEMVVVKDIPFSSLCEHHMLPFTGTATVAYIPGKRVVGLSKIPRLVDAFAKRLQVQERLTNQIADAMVEHLDPIGVGVIIKGHHSCMSLRGVGKSGTMMTSALRGVMRTKPEARAEFLHLG
jgi:GTP cyclohydrolase I